MTYDLPDETIKQASCAALDATDPLHRAREAFELPAGVIYLDGMSLGALPRSVSAALPAVVDDQWGQGLVRSWNSANWIDAPRRVGAKIAPLLGAEADEVIVADSTSVNLFKLLVAALRLRPGRPVLLTETSNFPTDVYVARGVADLFENVEVRIVPPEKLSEAWDHRVAVALLTHADFRSACLHDMAAVTQRAHDVGALVLWDLSHSAGVMPLELGQCNVDLAVGCGYKYLNGGPGAPAYAYVAHRHQRETEQPITAWMGHARPFDFSLEYAPAEDISRFLSGTPSILALAALEASLEVFRTVDLPTLRAKSLAMSEFFLRIVQERLGSAAPQLASPSDPARRGGHLAFRHAQGYAVMQALIERGVIGDFREPDLMRFGFAPLYLRFADIWNGATALADVLQTRAWDQPRFARRSAVT